MSPGCGRLAAGEGRAGPSLSPLPLPSAAVTVNGRPVTAGLLLTGIGLGPSALGCGAGWEPSGGAGRGGSGAVAAL